MTQPEELQQWVIWKYIDGRKVPFCADGTAGRVNDPSTFRSFAECRTAFCEGDYEGVGFVFTDSDLFCGVDLDKCRDPETGELDDWAEDILQSFAGLAYAEISPSKTGVKLITRARKPEGSRSNNQQGVECYDRLRWFAITGEGLGAPFSEIGDGQEQLDQLIQEHLSGSRGEVSTAPVRLTSGPNAPLGLMLRAEAYLDSCKPASKGSLRNSAFSISGHLHSLLGDMGERLSDSQVLELLRRWNMSNTDRLRDEELAEAARNGRTNGTPPADKMPQVMQSGLETVDLSYLLGGNQEWTPADTDPANPGSFPRDVIPKDGVIGETVKYNLETAMYPQPELALAAALSLVATVTGRKVEDEYGTRTNTYIVGLADSGAGKEQGRKVNKKILDAAGASNRVGPERLASSAGLSSCVSERLAVLLQLDEVGHLLATMKNAAKSPHLFNIGTVLMQLYSSSDTLWQGDAYADSKKNIVIDQPHCVVYGTTTPQGFWSTLSADNVANGLLGRLMVFEAPGRAARRKPERKAPPKSLVDQVRWWESLSLQLDESMPAQLVARKTAEAEDRFEDHLQSIHERHDSETPERAAVWSRTGEKTAKLALLFACSRQSGSPNIEISLDDVDRAIKISNWLTRRMLYQACDYVAENLVEDNKKRVLRAIGDKELSRTALTRKTQWLKAKERSEILVELQEAGQIEVFEKEEDAQPGRPGVFIRRSIISS